MSYSASSDSSAFAGTFLDAAAAFGLAAARPRLAFGFSSALEISYIRELNFD